LNDRFSPLNDPFRYKRAFVPGLAAVLGMMAFPKEDERLRRRRLRRRRADSLRGASMHAMYLNTNGLMDEEKALKMSLWIPAYETMVCIRGLASDDFIRVKQAFADLAEELLEGDVE